MDRTSLHLSRAIVPVMARIPDSLETRQVLDIVQSYTVALDLLDDYDHQRHDSMLVAVTIMIAESKPEEKDTMGKLVMNFLKR